MHYNAKEFASLAHLPPPPPPPPQNFWHECVCTYLLHQNTVLSMCSEAHFRCCDVWMPQCPMDLRNLGAFDLVTSNSQNRKLRFANLSRLKACYVWYQLVWRFETL